MSSPAWIQVQDHDLLPRLTSWTLPTPTRSYCPGHSGDVAGDHRRQLLLGILAPQKREELPWTLVRHLRRETGRRCPFWSTSNDKHKGSAPLGAPSDSPPTDARIISVPGGPQGTSGIGTWISGRQSWTRRRSPGSRRAVTPEPGRHDPMDERLPNCWGDRAPIKHRIKELRKGREQPFLAIFDSGDYLRRRHLATAHRTIDGSGEPCQGVSGVRAAVHVCRRRTGRQTSRTRDGFRCPGTLEALEADEDRVYLNGLKAEAEAGSFGAARRL